MRWFKVSLAILIPVIALAPPGASAEQSGLAARVAELEARVEALEAVLQFVRVESEGINGLAGPHWIVEGANVHVRSGSRSTSDGCDIMDRTCESICSRAWPVPASCCSGATSLASVESAMFSGTPGPTGDLR